MTPLSPSGQAVLEKCANAKYAGSRNDYVDGKIFECGRLLPTIEQLLRIVEMQRSALELYTNYDKETARHMDTEHLPPSRVAVIKPLDYLNKGYAPDGKHPSEIHQDETFTYGPKYRLGKAAREALTRTEEMLKELSNANT